MVAPGISLAIRDECFFLFLGIRSTGALCVLYAVIKRVEVMLFHGPED